MMQHILKFSSRPVPEPEAKRVFDVVIPSGVRPVQLVVECEGPDRIVKKVRVRVIWANQ